MDFEFIGVCKHCKSETHFVLSPDAPNEYPFAIRCHMCGHAATDQDIERFFHLTDTLSIAARRNDLTSILKIIFHER